MAQLAVTVAPLARSEVDLAYPLVSLGDLRMSLEAWRTLAEEVLERKEMG